ncbi:MAG: 23S rRNA (adenine(2503)-C(2))-methyltransferase RlmN [Candidatus Kuenenia sp.]|nr:23S rRNA (adenine(2503)-C(2))-methyltransferase RlmN [Candidatus Kuenenia hertensis]
MDTLQFTSITELNLSEMVEFCASLEGPSYRGEQIFSWIYNKGATSFNQMSNIPVSFREQLAVKCRIFQTKMHIITASKDKTEKFLLRLPDNNFIECVLLRDGKRNTVCVSTQVGCAMDCKFCASGILGLKRSLNTGEIIEQILHIKNHLPSNEHITNIVFMGIGEPLANYENVIKALRIINADWGLGIGARNITISTVGVIDGIRRLSREGLKVNLAISLHAPNDAIRNIIVPSNKKTGLRNIIAVAREYFNATRRDICFEYTIIEGINDSKQDAKLLAQTLKGVQCNINILPLNPVKEYNLTPPSPEAVEAFCSILRNHGIVATVRQKKGNNVNAACGQLRLRIQKS